MLTYFVGAFSSCLTSPAKQQELTGHLIRRLRRVMVNSCVTTHTASRFEWKPNALSCLLNTTFALLCVRVGLRSLVFIKMICSYIKDNGQFFAHWWNICVGAGVSVCVKCITIVSSNLASVCAKWILTKNTFDSFAYRNAFTTVSARYLEY